MVRRFFSGSHRVIRSPVFKWEQSDDRVVMAGPGLRLAFARFGERWTHRLELSGEDESEIASAVESDLERDSPGRVVSPVYQEIHRHERALEPGLCLLLTGRLFQHHFSAAVDLRIDPIGPRVSSSISTSQTVVVLRWKAWPRPTRFDSTAAHWPTPGHR